MKFKKIALILVMALCLTSTSSVFAANFIDYNESKSLIYVPMWNNTVSVKTLVEESDSEIKASAVVISRNNAEVSGTLYLQKYKRGRWKTVESWSVEGSGFTKISEYYSGSSGKYRTKLSINVGGENITSYSAEKNIN